MGYERYYTGTLTFNQRIPINAITEQYALLQESDLFTLTTEPTADGPALTGMTLDYDGGSMLGWAKPFRWDTAFSIMEGLARTHHRALTANNITWRGDGDEGISIVDAGGLLHHITTVAHTYTLEDTTEPDDHYARRCTCYATPAPGSWIRDDQITPHDQVRTQPRQAGPFTDYQVICDAHGEVACTTAREIADYRRERHLLAEHTPRPLPLVGTQRAARSLTITDAALHLALTADDTLPTEVDQAITRGAEALSRAGRNADPNPLRLRWDAQQEAQKAIDALSNSHPNIPFPNLPFPERLTRVVHHMIETEAQRR
ncbi:hypothetical protein ACH4VR_29670 [Streptomyces sp. NPDC020883]|uniref:hypothetical protein n=1 Tax=Streptomyces sp. NPDC020883 TaxID=3365099 RepID=UPI0037908A42